MEQTIKRDVYAIVTDRIIEKLEQGTVPWKQPWQDAGLPQNLLTHRPYRGINVMLLSSLGYSQNCFLTFNQVRQLGGTVKKNEKANIVVYWKLLEPKKTNASKETCEQKRVPLLRYYHVFNVAQCDGIPTSLIPRQVRTSNPIAECETIVKEMPSKPCIQHKEARAYYHPKHDFVNVPNRELFVSDEAYYATLFHELIHSTGHPTRLNRTGITEMSTFGSELYSFEELVAEIGACYLESYSGIANERFDFNIAYIKGWLKKLKNDKRFIVQASALAQKATDFILNIQHHGDTEDACSSA